MRVITLLLFLFLVQCVATPPYMYVNRGEVQQTPTGTYHHRVAEDFPIDVFVSLRGPDGYFQSYMDAASAWNKAAGVDVFRVLVAFNTKAQGGIHISDENLRIHFMSGRIYGYAHNITKTSGRIIRSEILLYDRIPENVRVPVIMHELGHALGLSHDANPSSLLFPEISDEICQVIQEEDLAVIARQVLGTPYQTTP